MMAAQDTVTVAMSERVTYEITLTHTRLADVLGVAIAEVPALLAEASSWNQTYGPGGDEDNTALLEVIDQEPNWDSAEDREWSIR